jgi:hypothetical protein
MSSFQTGITLLGPTASFYDWFYQYNNSVIGKLNSSQISIPYAGDGITLSSATNGGYTFALSGSVSKNMTFSGDVVFSGLVQLSNTELGGLAFGVTGNYLGIGVTVGKVVKVISNGGLTLAKADDVSNAEVLGIAIDVNSSRTVVAVAGKISGTTLSSNLISGGFTSGCVYFLDPSVAGGITRAEPSVVGQVSKPMLLGLSTTEGVILPYRGQYITGVSGSSGENLFNTAVYVNVKSEGEVESSFGLRPGTILATEQALTDAATQYESSIGSNAYFKATNSTPQEKILGIVSEYVGSYNATIGGNILLKVNTNGSVISGVANLNNWTGLDSGVIYLDASGLPTTTRPSGNVVYVGNVSDGDLVLNIDTPSQVINSGSSSSGISRNVMINGSLHLWQRGRGVTTPYGITAGPNANKKYLADKWVMWGVSGENGYTGSRGDFSLTQTEVGGYPKYYVSLIKNTNVSSSPAYFYNVINDVRVLADKQFTLSFYARTPGGTGTFAIHSIQNLTISGNTYANGTTYSVKTTANANWARYSTTFIGVSAPAGVSGSYSLIGVRLDENGKTFDFAQFILEEGSTASVPQIVDINEEYQRAAPYYQRSYKPDELTGTTTNFSQGINIHVMPYPQGQVYKFPVSMKKTPTVEYYSPNGAKDDALLELPAGTLSMKSSNATPCYGGTRTYNSAFNVLSITPQSDSAIRILPYTGYCTYDRIYFHYVADADTTIN